jgi:hypothetical protein
MDEMLIVGRLGSHTGHLTFLLNRRELGGFLGTGEDLLSIVGLAVRPFPSMTRQSVPRGESWPLLARVSL